MPLLNLPSVQNLSGQQLATYTQNALNQIQATTNGLLTFQNNILSNQVAFYFANANTDYHIYHGLGETPSGYFPVRVTPGVVIAESIKNMSSNLTLGVTIAILQCNTQGTTATIMFYK